LLAQLGIENVVWNSSNTRVTSAQDGTAGYILTRTTERNHRPVVFVFAGTSDKPDGEPIFLDRTLLKQSINYKLLESGLAFPTYYKGLFPDLRSEMTDTVIAARSNDKGFWPEDKTNSGVSVTDIEAVTERYVILPKLFRRIINYIGNGGDIVGFKEHLALNPEPILIISQAHFTNFDTIVNVEGNIVELEKVPEDVIFLT